MNRRSKFKRRDTIKVDETKFLPPTPEKFVKNYPEFLQPSSDDIEASEKYEKEIQKLSQTPVIPIPLFSNLPFKEGKLISFKDFSQHYRDTQTEYKNLFDYISHLNTSLEPLGCYIKREKDYIYLRFQSPSIPLLASKYVPDQK